MYIYLPSIGSLDPGDARRVEAGLRWWNKHRWLLLHLAGESSGASDEPMWCEFLGSGALDLVGSFFPSLSSSVMLVFSALMLEVCLPT